MKSKRERTKTTRAVKKKVSRKRKRKGEGKKQEKRRQAEQERTRKIIESRQRGKKRTESSTKEPEVNKIEKTDEKGKRSQAKKALSDVKKRKRKRYVPALLELLSSALVTLPSSFSLPPFTTSESIDTNESIQPMIGYTFDFSFELCFDFSSTVNSSCSCACNLAAKANAYNTKACNSS
ncbi:hypothetical protein Tco_0367242 [Tanacetum coccineum]